MICVCRKVLVYCLIGCLGFFWNPNTAVPPAFSFSPNLWWDYSSVYYLHVYSSNESSELILFHPTFHYCQLLGPSVDLLIFFNLLWALYPASVCTMWHSLWLAKFSPSLSTWPCNKVHIILACNLPVLVISSWWLLFYQPGVAFLLSFWLATILVHCSWANDVFLILCFLWFLLPVVLAESSHQIALLETRRRSETPNIFHIPHGDSALSPTTQDFNSFTSSWFLVAVVSED